jgi:hypothetical protein
MPIYPYSFTLPPVNKQDIPSDGVAGEFLGISAGGVLDWLPVSGGGGGDMLKSENLSGLADYPTARTNLGLGTTDTPTFKNLVISTGTIATSAPVTISQTWNGTGSTVFKALVVNATTPGTTSSSSSLLLDLQVGGSTVARITKSGQYGSVAGQFLDISGSDIYLRNIAGGRAVSLWADECRIVGGPLVFSDSTNVNISAISAGVALYKDAANTLALRNGTNAQTFNVYGTYTSGSVYERMFARYNASDLAFEIGTQQAGATARPLILSANGSKRITLEVTGSEAINAYSYGNNSTNILALRTLNTVAKYQFYVNSSGKSELYVGTLGALISESGLSYFNGGNVGIGTTAPSSKLHVVGNGLFGEKISTGSATPLNVSFGGTYGTSAPGSKANLKWDLYTDAIATNRFGIGMSVNLMEIQAGDGAGFGFYPNAGTTSALHIISSGNVGIGTTAPAAKLEVVGNILLPNAATIGNAVTSLALGGGNFYPSGTSGAISTLGTASVPFFGIWVGTSANAAFLTSDSADTLALRNAGAPQAFRVYNTYTDASNYERGGMAWIGGALHVGVLGTAGTGSPTRALQFVVNNGAAVWNISTAGHFLTNGDNAYDIGASGANRPRNVYVANNVTVGNTLSVAICDVTAIRLASNGTGSVIRQDSNGIIRLSNNNETDFNRLQFGGAADTAPAIARDGAGIKFTGAAAGLTSHIKVPAVAVLSLPSAGTAGVGARAFVNDALSPVFGSTVATGGAVAVPVYSDGSAWKVG